jgi:hypothetical protein
MRLGVTVVIAATFWVPLSFAQTKEEQLQASALQESSEKFLLLRATKPLNKTSMPDFAFQEVLQAVEQLRFTVADWDVNSQETMNWCLGATEEAQIKAGEVTTKGQGRVTVEAIKKRCSELVTHSFEASHACVQKVDKKGRRYWECSVTGTVTLKKYKADVDAEGKVSFAIDPAFGKGGTMTLSSTGTGSSEDMNAAISGAAFSARLWLERKVRDIEYFQLRSPIVEHKKATSYFCLSKEIVELDTPFHVLKPTEKGIKKVGFVKARKLYSGCTMTPSLEEKQKKGEKVEIRPSEAQDIIGSGNIQPGMTMWEMPSIGLNVGGGIATMPFDWGKVAPGGQIETEYNLARHIGISEFHVALHLKFGVTLWDFENIYKKYGPILQFDVGVIKRWYVRRVFFDAGLFYAESHLLKKNEEGDFEFKPYAVGALVQGGLGFQVSPRFIWRLNGGLRFGTNVMDGAPKDMGIVAGTDLLYNF